MEIHQFIISFVGIWSKTKELNKEHLKSRATSTEHNCSPFFAINGQTYDEHTDRKATTVRGSVTSLEFNV